MGQHIEIEKLKVYIEDNAIEADRLQIEEHLGECDTCFERYLQHIEEWSIPASLSSTFTDDTIHKLKTANPILSQSESKAPSKQDYRRKTLTNYLLAVGLTVVFMFSGVFQFMASISDKLNIHDEPISEQLVTKATSFLYETNIENGEEESENE